VYLVDKGKITRRAVDAGPDLDGKMEVMSGLEVGDSVIVSGSTLLREGGVARVVGPLGDETRSTGGSRKKGDSASKTPGKGGAK
jgi:imidazolonepropionase-like amidohydrolase